jgi:hypothetical protein
MWPFLQTGTLSPSNFLFLVQIAYKELKIHLEDSNSLMEHLDMLLSDCMEDFPDDDKSAVAEYAAKITRASITEQTRTGHTRLVKSARLDKAIAS